MVLTVEAAAEPLITAQPFSQLDILLGSPITLRVDASSDAQVRYQWRRNGVKLRGATASTYSIPGFQPRDGGNYSVVVSDGNGAVKSQSASLTPNIPLLPFADNFGTPVAPIIAGPGAGFGRADNRSATRESGEPKHAGNRGQRTIWLQWVATVSGKVTMNTDGSSFDTLLAVYTGDNVGDLDSEAFKDDDDDDDEDDDDRLTSTLKFSAEAGTVYRIAIAGHGGASGDIVLSWNLEPTAVRLPKILSGPQDRSARRGSRVDLGVLVADETKYQIEWRRNGTPLAAGKLLSIAALGSAQVGVYVARVFNPATGSEIFSESAIVQIHERADGVAVTDVLARDKYTEANESLNSSAIQVAGLRPRLPRRASLARGYSGTQIFNTYGATTEEGEPNHCGVVGGASQWFAYQAEADGQLVINTEGSDYDTVLAVYAGDGSSYASLQSVACNNDHEGNPWSSVTFAASNGTIYYVAIDGVNGATGTATINYALDPPPTVSVIASQTANEDSTLSVSFSVNDIGTALNNLSLAATSSDPLLVPAANIVLSGSDGNRAVTITPAVNRSGSVTISVAVSDGTQSAAASFALTIQAVNDVPTARGDAIQGPQGEPLKLSIVKLMANDSDADGDALVFSGVATPTSNGASVQADTRWIYYTPPGGFSGIDLVTYTVRDAGGAEASATITINLSATNASQAPNSIGMARTESGYARVSFVGITGRTYTIQASSDLVNWSAIGTSSAGSNGAYEFMDVAAPNYPLRYYRSVWP